jgi:hypothetical protein
VVVFHRDLEAIEALSFGCRLFGGKLLLRFLLTMPSEIECKNMGDKVELLADSLSQSVMSAMRLISSAVQKDA